jgi:methylmalonyl-CoA/ethylmalonyl-CoA epimerase
MITAPMRFHHVGIGTVAFEEAIETYRTLGYRLILSAEDLRLDVRVAFLYESESPLIEVVSPLGPDGPLKSFIARKMLPSAYHTCYATEHIESCREQLRDLGFLPLGEPQPAVAFAGARIAYHYHPAIGLLELVENPPEWPVG